MGLNSQPLPAHCAKTYKLIVLFLGEAVQHVANALNLLNPTDTPVDQMLQIQAV